MLKILTTASDPVEQSLLLAGLSDAGIRGMGGAGGARAAFGSGRDILVEEEDLARAQEVLKEEDEGFDEEELARLSEEAGRKAVGGDRPVPEATPADGQDAGTPVEAPVPTSRHGFLKAVERLAKPGRDKEARTAPSGAERISDQRAGDVARGASA
jgi:hypothetical protein